jgi:DNA invertase Pin-like site-specific DNA recombinase
VDHLEKTKELRVALYARVSKAEEQHPENQLIQLREWAKNTGATVVGEFEESISTRETRPIKEELKRKARIGEINAIAIVSLDRWGRGMSELVLDIEEFIDRGVTLISLKEGLQFDTAAGKLYAHLLAAFANFERERNRERTIAGLNRARAQGKVLGRPRKTPPVNPDQALDESIEKLKNDRFSGSGEAAREYPNEWTFLKDGQIAKQRRKCASCGDSPEELILDHIRPIAEGGFAFDKNNVQALCFKCNSKKTSDDLIRMSKTRVERKKRAGLL